MPSPISYQSFLSSLTQSKLHFVSGRSLKVKGVGILREPAYVLETSGSVDGKVFVHNLSGIEKACASFFKTFKMNADDKWGLCLSSSHVAGFSVLARSHFGGLEEPYCFKWSKEDLKSEIIENDVTILSLVPTQIFDIVKMSIAAPPSLRMVFVGGAKLSVDLREAAVKLGWPIVECYGSTETFAQMAYSIEGCKMRSFVDWQIKEEDGELMVRGPGLFAAQIKAGVYRSRKTDWFSSGDLAAVEGGQFEVLGKKGGLIKIKGSYFDFNKFKENFFKEALQEGLSPKEVFPLCLEEGRDGAGVYLVSQAGKLGDDFLKKFNDIRGVFYIDDVERSDLGKLKASSLEDVLKKTVRSL